MNVTTFIYPSLLLMDGFPSSTSDKELACQCRRYQEKWVRSLGQEDNLEESTATHSSILAQRIPWTEEPGGLSIGSIGSQSWVQLKRLSTHVHTVDGYLGGFQSLVIMNKAAMNISIHISWMYTQMWNYKVTGQTHVSLSRSCQTFFPSAYQYFSTPQCNFFFL